MKMSRGASRPFARHRAEIDLWLFGGGRLFHSLLAMQLVDTVEVAIVPILLGGGIPLLPTPGAPRQSRIDEAQGLPEKWHRSRELRRKASRVILSTETL